MLGLLRKMAVVVLCEEGDAARCVYEEDYACCIVLGRWCLLCWVKKMAFAVLVKEVGGYCVG